VNSFLRADDEVRKMAIEFVSFPPRIFLVFLGAVLLVVLLSMVLKRGSAARKITALVIVLVVLGVVTFLFYRPTVVSVDEQGLTVKRFRIRSVTWPEVSEAIRIGDLSGSEYRPTGRIVGVSLGAYKVGMFRLQNGDRVQAVMEQDRDALLIATRGEGYLFALNKNEGLVEAVSRFIEVEEPKLRN
jgi:hypothetical protein